MPNFVATWGRLKAESSKLKAKKEIFVHMIETGPCSYCYLASMMFGPYFLLHTAYFD